MMLAMSWEMQLPWGIVVVQPPFQWSWFWILPSFTCLLKK